MFLISTVHYANVAFVYNAEYIQDNERCDAYIKPTCTFYEVCSFHLYRYHTFLCMHTLTVIVVQCANVSYSWKESTQQLPVRYSTQNKVQLYWFIVMHDSCYSLQ